MLHPKALADSGLEIFKNHNFDLEDKERERAPKTIEVDDLEAILDDNNYF